MFKNKAEELLQVISHTTLKEFRSSIDISHQIYLIEKKEVYDLHWILGAIYQARKIEGVRKERQNKRRNNKDYEVLNDTTLKNMG